MLPAQLWKGLLGKRWRHPSADATPARRVGGGVKGMQNPRIRAPVLRGAAEHPGGGKPPIRCRVFSIYNLDCGLGLGEINIAYTFKRVGFLAAWSPARTCTVYPGFWGVPGLSLSPGIHWTPTTPRTWKCVDEGVLSWSQGSWRTRVTSLHRHNGFDSVLGEAAHPVLGTHWGTDIFSAVSVYFMNG